ncbi:phosphotransferase [Actinoplanes palleronii]|uniref:phosphotransferase n=1 Tax=Actinoplanes palleronii TaxID=113570 RepID=UPI001940988F|nr:phosphotransferase [Actinoplanes palleronii]
MNDELDHLRRLLPGVRLDDLGLLTGSNRSRVRRVRADSRTVIVKEFVTAGTGWARETAALAVIPPAVRAPRLVAAGSNPPIVVMTDAGPGTSVAGALLGADPAVATSAVVAWASAIGELHRETTGSRAAFRAALHARAGDQPVPESTMPAFLDDAADVIARASADLAVEVPAGAWEELRTLNDRLGVAALTPSDACPDNNVCTDDGLVLIDFEGAQWRPVAWDLAYLTVPWPSCWCSWRIPAAVTERAVDAYRAAFPGSGADPAAFRRDVEAAATGWAYLSASWFLPRALLDDPPGANPDRPRPGYRAMILDRFGSAREAAGAGTPALAELAGRLHDALTVRWGSVVLPYAPAFSRGEMGQRARGRSGENEP